MYFLYSFLLTLGIGLLLPLFLLDALRHGKYLAGLRERLGNLPRLETGGRPVIWLHCVSVGETQAARPLAQALLASYPTHALVVSTTTLTGQRLARELFRAEAAAIIFFPFDWAWTVRRALKAVQPAVVLIMETELWPRFLRECRARQVPVAIVNGRISEKSFRGYKCLGSFIRRAVDDITLALMQTESDAARLQALGLAAGRIRVAGNVKFDIKIEAEDQALTHALRERFVFDNQRPLIIAASTHAPEEAVCLAAYEQLLATSDAQPRLLIAPRHPERFAEVAALLETSGLRWARRSANLNEQDRAADVILLDSIGELRAVYSLAEIVFVGGSIARTGGHNVLEPAAAAKCIVTGAHTFNFTAVMRDFLEQGALVQLPDMSETAAPASLARTFDQLLKNDARRQLLGQRARATLDENSGATARTIELLAPIFSERSEVRGQRSVSKLVPSDFYSSLQMSEAGLAGSAGRLACHERRQPRRRGRAIRRVGRRAACAPSFTQSQTAIISDFFMPSVSSTALLPLSAAYGVVTRVRLALYQSGLLPTYQLDAPVISVGNLTVGGTGKTPLVEWLARAAARDGKRVCVLSRGYKRTDERERILVSDGEQLLAGAREGGDEPRLLAEKLLGIAAVISDADRIGAARWAQKNLASEVFILDDGFQHLRLKRDLNIVALDGTNPWGGGHLLPRGRLREPLHELRRADCIVITRAEAVPDLSELRDTAARLSAGRPVFSTRTQTSGVRPLHTQSHDELQSAASLPQPLTAFCALGNPQAFFTHARRSQLQLADTRAFPDHHAYTQNDIDALSREAARTGAQALLTTAKDAVKLQHLSFPLPCFVLEIELAFDDEPKMLVMVRQALRVDAAP